jgi:isoquinoline 1-oxidoreductase alpha subunit
VSKTELSVYASRESNHRLLTGEIMAVINVNGKDHSVDVVADMPLLWVLRDVLDLTGTRFGCGIGACGACTVHLDDQEEQSCQLIVADVVGKKVTTIEGLSKDGRHPVQVAWCQQDVPQCGYCQSGQVMTAAALLKRVPNPTDSDIDKAFDGHICRCGTYVRMREAIKAAASAGVAAVGAK